MENEFVENFLTRSTKLKSHRNTKPFELSFSGCFCLLLFHFHIYLFLSRCVLLQQFLTNFVVFICGTFTRYKSNLFNLMHVIWIVSTVWTKLCALYNFIIIQWDNLEIDQSNVFSPNQRDQKNCFQKMCGLGWYNDVIRCICNWMRTERKIHECSAWTKTTDHTL